MPRATSAYRSFTASQIGRRTKRPGRRARKVVSMRMELKAEVPVPSHDESVSVDSSIYPPQPNPETYAVLKQHSTKTKPRFKYTI